MLRLLLLLALAAVGCEGHARLVNPASRSAAWRFGFKNPKNVNDNQLNCGGAGHQHGSQRGKCGFCGDPYQVERPRPNEDGGKYGRGIITKTYSKGEWIDVGIDVTANHRGWFEVRLCNLDAEQESEACFEQHLLEVKTGGYRWNLPGGVNKLFTYQVKLPDGLVCSRCTLQWKWRCGNNWGVDKETGKGCTGCGPQEEFWSCSDIGILGDDGEITSPPKQTSKLTVKSTTTSTTTTTTSTSTTTTQRPTTQKQTTTQKPTTPQPTTQKPTTQKPATPQPTTQKPTTQKPTTPQPTTQKPTTQIPKTQKPITQKPTTPQPTTQKPTTQKPRTQKPTTQKPTTLPPYTRPPTPYETPKPTPRPGSSRRCRATGLYARVANSSSYDYYCRTNCAVGHCPRSVCRCD